MMIQQSEKGNQLTSRKQTSQNKQDREATDSG